MPCVRRKNHYEKTESITFFYHYDIGGRTGYAFFTVVYLFLFIAVCIPVSYTHLHPLVQYITEHQDGENAEMICEQLYDLAKLQHAPLDADAMTKFVARSNDIMMLLTK